MSNLNFNPFRRLRSGRPSSVRGNRTARKLRLELESLESRCVLATLITGIVATDTNGNGAINAGEPGKADVWVYVDANNNDQLDLQGSIVEPDDFPDGAAITTTGATFSVVNTGGVKQDKTVVAYTETPDATTPTPSTGTKVFGYTDAASSHVTYFHFNLRLRVDFSTPISAAQLDFTGGEHLQNATSKGVLEAYNAAGTLIDSYETKALGLNKTETMDVSGASNIAYIVAYTQIPDVFGRLDALRINGNGSEQWTITHADGHYTLPMATGGSYRINEVVPTGYTQTLPATGNGSQLVAVATDATAAAVDFANKLNPGWQNPVNHLDIDDDGQIIPFDALLIINELNEPQHSDATTRQLDPAPTPVPAFFDVNGDGFVTPSDAILVINYLNEQAAGAVPAVAEGEATALSSDVVGSAVEAPAKAAVMSADAAASLDGRDRTCTV